MGNKASFLFGGGSQNASTQLGESSEFSDGGESPKAALSEQEKAEAARYSELFGGKPKAKTSHRKKQVGHQAPSFADDGNFERTSARISTHRSKKTAARKSKKLRAERGDERGTGSFGGNSADEGGDSSPVSPFRGKAAWVQQESLSKERDTMTEESMQQQVVDAVTAKIEDLEKEQQSEGVLIEGEDDGAPMEKEGKGSGQEVVTFDEATARNRTAVTNALFAGVDVSAASSKELLSSDAGGGVLDGAGAGVLGGVAETPAKHINPRPPPQRNFKAKN